MEDAELDYWAKRLDKLKREHHNINEIIAAEYNKTYGETIKLCEPRTVTTEKISKVQPLSQWQAKVSLNKIYNHYPYSRSPY